jgi:alkylhydroperoxidase family enzyme
MAAGRAPLVPLAKGQNMASEEHPAVARPEPVPALIPPRVAPGGRAELGLFGWLFCRLSARVWGVPEVHLFTVLAQHKRLFWPWLPFSGMLLRRGRLPEADTELAILRVGHLRASSYELQQHRRIALRRGVSADEQDAIFAGPDAEGLSSRQRILLTGVDELIGARMISDSTWQQLSDHLDRRQLIEFVTLVGQYDALALTLNTLRVPMDYPD